MKVFIPKKIEFHNYFAYVLCSYGITACRVVVLSVWLCQEKDTPSKTFQGRAIMGWTIPTVGSYVNQSGMKYSHRGYFYIPLGLLEELSIHPLESV